MLKRIYHLPTRANCQGDLPADERARLERVLLLAVERAVKKNAAAGSEIVAANSSGIELERFDTGRYQAGAGTYGVPSYDKAGELIQVPIQKHGSPAQRPRRRIDARTAAENDRVIEGKSPFENNLIAIFPHWQDVRVQGDRYAIVSDIARATRWGRLLFGARTFAIFEGPLGSSSAQFYVVGTSHALHAMRMSPGSGTAIRGGTAWSLTGRTEWVPMQRDIGQRLYLLRGLFTTEGEPMWPSNVLLAEKFYQEFQQSQTAGRDKVAAGTALRAVFADIDKLIHLGQVQPAADRLAELSADAFALVDWNSKSRYIGVLVQAWTRHMHEVAILEIVKSMQTRSELLAALGLLRMAGAYDKLFDDLDDELWSLLTTVGERFGQPGGINRELLLNLLTDAGLLPKSLDEMVSKIVVGADGWVIGPDVLMELEEAVQSFIRAVGDALDGIISLISHPEKIVEGAAQLLKLCVTVLLAQSGHTPSQIYLTRVITSMGTKVVAGLKGAQVIGVSEKILRRVRWALIWELASWFIGVGEVKAILSSVGFSEKAILLARMFRLLGLFSKTVDAEKTAAQLAHLATLLSKVGLIQEDETLLRLLGHLPEEDLLRLGRELEKVDVKGVNSMAQLAEKSPELRGAAQHALERAEGLYTLEQRAGQLTDNLVQGFQKLARRSGFSNAELQLLMIDIPAEHAELFMRMVRVMPEQALGRGIGARSVGFFRGMATRPRSMQFLIDSGYGTFAALYRHSNYSIVRFEESLEALTTRVSHLPAGQREVAYQKALDRIAQDDAEILNELNDIRRKAMGLKPVRSYTLAELDQIVGTTPDIRKIRELAKQMHPGTGGELFERWVNHYVFHEPVGVPRARFKVRAVDNPHVTLPGSRTADFPITNEGWIWDSKIYQAGGEIDAAQLYDYEAMEGHLMKLSDGREVTVTQVNYIFSDRAAAAANLDPRAAMWYIDDLGKLHLLQ